MTTQRPTPWFDSYNNTNISKEVIVIGGGISGATTAYSLAKRGYHVSLFEKNNDLALEASGNYQAMLYGNFSGNPSPILELSLLGYKYSHALINKILQPNVEFENCGLIQLAYNQQQVKQQQQILRALFSKNLCYYINQTQIEEFSGTKVNCDHGLFYPNGLWLDPRKFINKLVDEPNIRIQLNSEIIKLNQLEEFKWQIEDSLGNHYYAPNIVLCNSYSVIKFTQLSNLYLRKIRGQISVINSNSALKTVLCANGYITPNKGDSFTIGATFKFNDNNTQIKQEEHLENINNFATITPQMTERIDLAKVNGKVSFRASTTDYMPLVGPIGEYTQFKDAYKNLAKDSNYWIDTPCPYLKGLFINVAHGAKGMLTAPICGEIIANYIENTLNISETLKDGLHPNRFWRKEIIRHQTSE